MFEEEQVLIELTKKSQWRDMVPILPLLDRDKVPSLYSRVVTIQCCFLLM